jgi:hypothetical protein
MPQVLLSHSEQLVVKILSTRSPSPKCGWWLPEIRNELCGELSREDTKEALKNLLCQDVVKMTDHGSFVLNENN